MEKYILDMSFIAEGNITKYAVVVAGSQEGKVTLPAGANASKIIGIAQNDAADGEPVRVRLLGISKAIAAGAISMGDLVQIADSAGKVQTASPAAGTNAFIVGVAMDAAGSAGEYVHINIMPSVYQG